MISRWGSIPFVDVQRGADWRPDPVGCAPNAAARQPEPLAVPVRKRTPIVKIQLDSFPFQLTSTPDVIEARVSSGELRINGGGVDVQTTPENPDTFNCTRDDNCECPPGQSYAGPPLNQLHGSPSPDYVAASAGENQIEASLEGFTLTTWRQRYCRGTATITYKGSLDGTVIITSPTTGNPPIETLTQNRTWSLTWTGPLSAISDNSGSTIPWTSASVSGSDQVTDAGGNVVCSGSLSAAPNQTFSAILPSGSTSIIFSMSVGQWGSAGCAGQIPQYLACPPEPLPRVVPVTASPVRRGIPAPTRARLTSRATMGRQTLEQDCDRQSAVHGHDLLTLEIGPIRVAWKSLPPLPVRHLGFANARARSGQRGVD